MHALSGLDFVSVGFAVQRGPKTKDKRKGAKPLSRTQTMTATKSPTWEATQQSSETSRPPRARENPRGPLGEGTAKSAGSEAEARELQVYIHPVGLGFRARALFPISPGNARALLLFICSQLGKPQQRVAVRCMQRLSQFRFLGAFQSCTLRVSLVSLFLSLSVLHLVCPLAAAAKNERKLT